MKKNKKRSKRKKKKRNIWFTFIADCRFRLYPTNQVLSSTLSAKFLFWVCVENSMGESWTKKKGIWNEQVLFVKKWPTCCRYIWGINYVDLVVHGEPDAIREKGSRGDTDNAHRKEGKKKNKCWTQWILSFNTLRWNCHMQRSGTDMPHIYAVWNEPEWIWPESP